MCECYQIGGRFIAEDPDCPAHGQAAQDRESRVVVIMRRIQEETDIEVLRDLARDLANEITW